MANRLCWVEFNTANVAEAMKFYGSVFDWTFKEGPMDGCQLISTGQSNFGGELCDDNPDGFPQHVLYLFVDSIDSHLPRIEAAGGKTERGKTEIPGNMGFYAWFNDPHGNLVGLYQMPASPPEEWDKQETKDAANPFCWVEFMAGDLEVSKKFYTDLFGWEFQPSHVEGYSTFSTSKDDIAGGLSAVHHEGTQHHIMYVMVADIDAALAKIEQAGGKMARLKHPIGENMGFVAHFNDPHGNLIGLYSHTG